MKRLLWIGDAGCDSGFAKATHNTLEVLRRDWDVTVLGLNYRGDPHPYPYPMYPAYVPGGDLFGVKRVIDVCAKVVPDCVVIQNDPWNIPRYIEKFDALRKGANLRPVLIGAIAIDGKNAMGESLNGLDHCIFWTRFAENEARLGGLTKSSSVVGLGVDLELFSPGDRTEARKRFGWPDAIPMGGFVALNVNRNQPRKRLDLTMEYFAEFFHSYKAENAYLYLHIAPTGDFGYDCAQLTKYYGLRGHVMMVDQGAYKGFTDAEMVDVYRLSNAYITTTVGEGWGLPAMEAMACGIPCILPDWSAYGEWATGSALMVPCPQTQASLNKVNTLGGLADKTAFVNALHTLYNVPNVCDYYSRAGVALAHQPQFRWENVGEAFAIEVEKAMAASYLGLNHGHADVAEGRPSDEGPDRRGEAVGAEPDRTGAVSGDQR